MVFLIIDLAMIFTLSFIFLQCFVSLARSIRGIIYRHQHRKAALWHK
jgi:hypothetical protein